MQVKIMTTSKKYKLNKEDFKKIGKGALIAITGAVLTFLIDVLPQIDYGDNQYLIVGSSVLLAVATNLVLKLNQGKK